MPLSDYRPQRRNANRHTQRGLGMLDNAISKRGWIGAITAAADGEVFDGSARLETVYERFGEEIEPIVVESDGTRPVVVIRQDIPTADDPKAIALSIEANRIAQVDLDWGVDVLAEWSEEGSVDLNEFWRPDELDKMVDNLSKELAREQLEREQDAPTDDEEEADTPMSSGSPGASYPLAIVLSFAEWQEWKVIKESLGEKKDTKAFLRLMRGEI